VKQKKKLVNKEREEKTATSRIRIQRLLHAFYKSLVRERRRRRRRGGKELS